VAGHKGQPAAVAKGAFGTRRRLKAAPGRGTLEKDRPPILGLIQRGGQVVMRMLADVRQKTIQPIIEAAVAKDARVHTDEYASLRPPAGLGLPAQDGLPRPRGVCADEDGDGFCEIHVNTMEGTWSLLRSWLRPHRGISQEKLPLYLGFFEFVHNARRRGKALLGALVAALVV
jgi:transposase-like protein